MNKKIDIEFEKAVRMLVEHLPVADENSKKPILAHDIRVGVYLYQNSYSQDVILAGLLHDILEFSDFTEEMLQEEFGENVLKFVKANSKNRTIENSDERIDELAKRATEAGEDALIIRAADTLDSFKHYTFTKNESELEYCRKNAEAILKYRPEKFEDEIFEMLENTILNLD